VQLAAAGHAVTLVDRAGSPGGMVKDTIPAARMPDSVLEREMRDVLASAGERLSWRKAEIGAECNPDTLAAEGFEARSLLDTAQARVVSMSTPLQNARAGAEPVP